MKFQSLGYHEQALQVRAQRNRVLASNIANADTPNFKARDIDFADTMKAVQTSSFNLQRTSALHQQAWSTTTSGAQLKYRVPTQPSMDGNTVQTDVEQAQFAENALQYRASLTFIDGQIKTLRYALKGGD